MENGLSASPARAAPPNDIVPVASSLVVFILGDAQAQRRLARPGPRRYARDRSHVCAAANPAKAQDRPSATRNHHQNTPDRDDLGNAQDESSAAVHESALGTKRTCQSCRSMSAFGGKADVG